MNNEITLADLWGVFARNWIKILVFVLVVALLAGCVTAFLIEKKYSSKISFYVINTNPDLKYTTSSYLSVSEHLSNDYIQIILSDLVLNSLSEQLKSEYGYNYTPAQLKAMISHSIIAESSIFDVKVTNSDPEHAYNIAKLISEEAPDALLEVVKPYLFDEKLENVENLKKEDITDCVKVINHPKVAPTHESPRLAVSVMISAIAAAFISYAFFLILSLLDTVVKSEDDIKQFVQKYPLIGTIPTWNEE